MSPKSYSSPPMLWPALLVGLFGLLWLAQEIKWLQTDLPLGPVAIIITALALVRYAYDK